MPNSTDSAGLMHELDPDAALDQLIFPPTKTVNSYL